MHHLLRRGRPGGGGPVDVCVGTHTEFVENFGEKEKSVDATY